MNKAWCSTKSGFVRLKQEGEKERGKGQSKQGKELKIKKKGLT